MTPQQIKTALKLYEDSLEQKNEFELLADSLQIDTNQIACELVALPSPDGMRQVILRDQAPVSHKNSTLSFMPPASKQAPSEPAEDPVKVPPQIPVIVKIP